MSEHRELDSHYFQDIEFAADNRLLDFSHIGLPEIDCSTRHDADQLGGPDSPDNHPASSESFNTLAYLDFSHIGLPEIEEPKQVHVSAKSYTSSEVEKKSELKVSAKRVCSNLGVVALAAAVSAAALIGYSELSSKDEPTRAAASQEYIEPPEAAENTPTSTNTAESVPATETSEPSPVSTTEAVAVTEPFSVGAGELVGVLKIPVLCDEIQVVAVSEQEKIDKLVGTGNSTLDLTNPDPTPNIGCETVDQRITPGFIRRTERVTRTSGNASQWQPLAVHEQRADGQFISVFPGQPGNSVIAGHGSTFSAPFAELGLLTVGDELIVDRADGKTFTYKMVESDVLPPDTIDPFLDYSHPDNPATLTLYMCVDESGNTGSSAKRLAVRFVLDQ